MPTRYTSGDGTIERARSLRRDATPAETLLWSALRGSALGNFKFRRQQRLGPYIADFVCQGAKLVVEVDGDTHGIAAAMTADARRTKFLAQEGYRTVRFGNADVMSNLDGVTATILAALSPSPSHPVMPGGPLPFPRGERRS